jgi:putative ATPase
MSLQTNSIPLFAKADNQSIPNTLSSPLAYKLAPKSLDEYIGQSHIFEKGKPLYQMIEQDSLFSMILWGPPGCGKTSLSRLIAGKTSAIYIALNAVTAKVSDVKDAIEKAKFNLNQNKRTLLFIDEIHRFNKLQQDALLPEVESGLITFIGATTENPYFSVIPGLISRAQVFEFEPLTEKHMHTILDNAITKISKEQPLKITTKAKQYLVGHANGDARKLINILEMADSVNKTNNELTVKTLENLTQSKGLRYNTDEHYDLNSAFIKSMRGSDPDAAVYWLARMLKGGENPEFIARRLIIFASEDVGNSDPMALVLATSVLSAAKFIGMPEVQINLSQVTTYLATAPKSNASYNAILKANKLIEEGKLIKVPDTLRDSHYKGAKKMGFGKGYIYPHKSPDGIVSQNYMPEQLDLYKPKELGHEKIIIKRLEYIKNKKNKK